VKVVHRFEVSWEDDTYVVRFPDLPYCMTDAETLDGLPEMIQEVYDLFTETLTEDGQAIPAPTPSTVWMARTEGTR